MTRNTTLYKTQFNKNNNKVDVYYRDLTVLEIAYFNNIKNEFIRREMAGKTVIINMDPKNVPYPTLERIGDDVYYKSTKEINDLQLLEICVSEFRESVQNDYALVGITKILEAFPGQQINNLLNLTNKDLIELMCLAERVLKQPLFDFKGTTKKKGMNLVNPKSLPDDGKSLQEKMNELNQHLT